MIDITKCLTTEQAARHLQLHPNTIRAHIRQKKLKALRMGYGYRITPKALDEYVQNQVVGTQENNGD